MTRSVSSSKIQEVPSEFAKCSDLLSSLCLGDDGDVFSSSVCFHFVVEIYLELTTLDDDDKK